MAINPERILLEDNHLLIYNKKPGDIVQGDKTGDKPMSDWLKDYIKDRYNKPGQVFLGVAHRLDRPVSGAVIFARTSKALGRLNRMFQQGEIRKTYWAIVQNHPPKNGDHLVHYLRRNTEQNKSYALNAPAADTQRAELIYQVIASGNRYFLLEIELLTGRHHQIRSQMAAIGCPIKGDLKYGASRSNPDGSIHLHARSLLFDHPVSKASLCIIAPPGNDPLWSYFVSTLPQDQAL